MISLLLGTCWRCEYQAKVGVGRDDSATVPVHWAPANCPSCGLVSVNVADLTPGHGGAMATNAPPPLSSIVAEVRRPNRETASRAPAAAS